MVNRWKQNGKPQNLCDVEMSLDVQLRYIVCGEQLIEISTEKRHCPQLKKRHCRCLATNLPETRADPTGRGCHAQSNGPRTPPTNLVGWWQRPHDPHRKDPAPAKQHGRRIFRQNLLKCSNISRKEIYISNIITLFQSLSYNIINRSIETY